MLTLDNGTEIFLHPNYSNTKFDCYKGTPEADHDVPTTGMGGTSGRGTYKYFKQKHYATTLRFKPNGPAQGEAKAKGQRAKAKAA